LYALIFDREAEKVWYGTSGVFETHGTGSRTNADYAIALTELAVGYYLADWPTTMPSGTYETIIFIRATSTPLDTDRGFGPAEKAWSGTRVADVAEQDAVNICNLALAKLGGGRDKTKITALGDGTKTSDLCKLLYTPIRKEVLAIGEWQEVTYYKDLGSESSVSEQADWEYVFSLPEDCLKVIKQTHEEAHTIEYDHKVVQSKLLTSVLSNTGGDSAYIEYVKNEGNADVFSQECVKAIAILLASELAPQTLGGDAGIKRHDMLVKEYETLVLPTSMGVNHSQQFNRGFHRTRFSIFGGRYAR
jgi:hypothetical protein